MAPRIEMFAVGLLAGMPGSVTVQLSASQLFEIAQAATKKGDETSALRAYESLISDASQEVRLEARFRLALIEAKRSNLTQAAPAGELAGILSKMGDKDGAWRQIRAVQAAGHRKSMQARRPS